MTSQFDSWWPPTFVGPMTPCAVKEVSPLSAVKSDARSRVPPLAVAFCTASWNSKAIT
ncbi:MAG TPA: hypothetical protein VHZ33_39155 [Trebonia sp.]|nr:hypothetical protein [Trebonia sp.]